MSHPYYHAKNSAKRFGGNPDDYIEIHNWFDQTKAHVADCRHRAILHSSFGIFLCEQVFGTTFTRKSDGVSVPTRLVGEQHCVDDFGFVPTLNQWINEISIKSWMMRGTKPLSKELSDKNEEQGDAVQETSKS